MFRVCCIGGHGIAARHRAAWLATGRVEIVGIFDVSGDIAEEAAGSCGARAYTELDAIYRSGASGQAVTIEPI